MKNNRWLILLLFVTGLAIVLAPHLAEQYNNYKQVHEVEEFQKEIAQKDDEEIDVELQQVKSCYKKFFYNEEGIHDPFEERNEKLNSFLDCLAIDQDEIFGSIEIPKLKLDIPIYLGSTDEILSNGIGHVEGSSLPLGGNSTHTILSGHRGMAAKEMFRNIDLLHEGDLFNINGKTGTLKYRVTQQRVIYPDETKYLNIEENKDMVTLLTCHPYRHNYQRLLIHAERVEDEPEDELQEDSSDLYKEVKNVETDSLKFKISRFWEQNSKIIIISIFILLLFLIAILFKKRR